MENGGNISWRYIHLEGNPLGIILGILHILPYLTPITTPFPDEKIESLKLKNLKFTEDMAKSGLEQ